MTKCKDCDVVDLGISKIIKDGEEYQLCPNCGSEDSVEEIDELTWLEDMEAEKADFDNELMEE